MQSTDPAAGPAAPAPGWYPDPWRAAPSRWWDGGAWTGYTSGPAPAPAPAPAVARRVAPARIETTLPAARNDIRGGGGIALAGFFGAVALSLLCAKVAAAAGARPLTVPNVVFSEAGLWAGLFAAAYVVTHRRPGGTIADLGFHSPTAAEIGIGITIGIVGLTIADRVAIFLRDVFPDNGGSHLFVTNTPSYSLIVVIGLLACFGAPIFEELFFRGLVQSVLMRDLGTTPAIVIQAMLFGLAHFELGMTFNQAAVRCGTVMVLGLFNGWLRARTGRLGAGVIAHTTYNLIVTFITLIAVAGLATH